MSICSSRRVQCPEKEYRIETSPVRLQSSLVPTDSSMRALAVIPALCGSHPDPIELQRGVDPVGQFFLFDSLAVPSRQAVPSLSGSYASDPGVAPKTAQRNRPLIRSPWRDEALKQSERGTPGRRLIGSPEQTALNVTLTLAGFHCALEAQPDLRPEMPPQDCFPQGQTQTSHSSRSSRRSESRTAPPRSPSMAMRREVQQGTAAGRESCPALWTECPGGSSGATGRLSIAAVSRAVTKQCQRRDSDPKGMPAVRKPPATAPTDDQTDVLRAEQVYTDMAASRKLAQEKMLATWANLQTEIFRIWEEVFLHRKQVMDELFDKWEKVLFG